jgi:hypothetical protein
MPFPRAWRRAAAAAAVAATLAGCATPGPGGWVKAGLDPREQRRDEYECARHAAFAVPKAARAAAFAECMRDRGYQRPESVTPPARARIGGPSSQPS